MSAKREITSAAANPASPPAPPSQSEPHELPCLGENPVKLAGIAAPFVAAGMKPTEALERAYCLIAEAEYYFARDAVFRDPLVNLTLDRTLDTLVIKSRATLRGYLFAIDPIEGPVIWQKALKGDRVFDLKLWGRLKAHQEKIRAARQEKSADVRRAKAVNKISSLQSRPAER